MKINKLILFEAITIFYLFVGCSSINDKQIAALKYRLPIFDSLPHLYKVERIRSINKIAYAIDLTDEGKYSYTLISLKSEKLEREKIKKGKKYLLIIKCPPILGQFFLFINVAKVYFYLFSCSFFIINLRKLKSIRWYTTIYSLQFLP